MNRLGRGQTLLAPQLWSAEISHEIHILFVTKKQKPSTRSFPSVKHIKNLISVAVLKFVFCVTIRCMVVALVVPLSFPRCVTDLWLMGQGLPCLCLIKSLVVGGPAWWSMPAWVCNPPPRCKPMLASTTDPGTRMHSGLSCGFGRVTVRHEAAVGLVSYLLFVFKSYIQCNSRITRTRM